MPPSPIAPTGASFELLRRTGVEPGQLGPNATPGRALTEAFRDKLESLRAESAAGQAGAAGAAGAAPASPPISPASPAAPGAPRAPGAPGTSGPSSVEAPERPERIVLRPPSAPAEAGPGDRVLASFVRDRSEPPVGALRLRDRAEDVLAHGAQSAAGAGQSGTVGEALRTQAFVQTLGIGVQAARRGPSSLEEAFRTLAQGGGGG